MTDIFPCCICHGTDQSGIMETNCLCRGTAGHIHEACLREALKYSGNTRCPTCKSPLPMTFPSFSIRPMIAAFITACGEFFYIYLLYDVLWNDLSPWLNCSPWILGSILSAILAVPVALSIVLNPVRIGLSVSIQSRFLAVSILTTLAFILYVYVLSFLLVWPYYVYCIIQKVKKSYRCTKMRGGIFVLKPKE